MGELALGEERRDRLGPADVLAHRQHAHAAAELAGEFVEHGISVTHGTHQVAHRLSRTGVPLRSAVARVARGVGQRHRGQALPGEAASIVPTSSPSDSAAASGCAPSRFAYRTPPERGRAQVSDQGKMGHVGLNRMWAGALPRPSAIMREINASIPFDKALWRQDIAASKAHAVMLGACGVIWTRTRRRSRPGWTVAAEHERDGVPEDWALEDIHMTVESRLAELIGSAAGRLHTSAAATTRWRPTSSFGCDAIDQPTRAEALQRGLVTAR